MEVTKERSPECKNEDGSTSVTTGFEGSWKQQGWTSNQGFVSAVTTNNAKVVDIHHMTNSCRYCSVWKDKLEEKKVTKLQYLKRISEHAENCRLNHDGSPQSMESTDTVEVYKRSHKGGIIRYNPLHLWWRQLSILSCRRSQTIWTRCASGKGTKFRFWQHWGSKYQTNFNVKRIIFNFANLYFSSPYSSWEEQRTCLDFAKICLSI